MSARDRSASSDAGGNVSGDIQGNAGGSAGGNDRGDASGSVHVKGRGDAGRSDSGHASGSVHAEGRGDAGRSDRGHAGGSVHHEERGDTGRSDRGRAWGRTRSNAGARAAVIVAALAGTALAVAVWRLQRPLEGPAPIAWDKEACAHCRMHIGQPRFAAQVQLGNGEVFSFDDPGCAAAWLSERRGIDGDLHALWFHAVDRDAWLSGSEVAFVPAGETPMGYGFGATVRGAPGAISLEALEAQVRARHETPGEHPSWR